MRGRPASPRRLPRTLTLTLALGLVVVAGLERGGAADPMSEPDPQSVAAIQRGRASLMRALDYMDSRADLFPGALLERARVLRPAQRADLLATWQSIGDALLALDGVRDAHADFARRRGADRGVSLHLYRAALLTQYRHALELIERFERDPGFDTLLDEPLPELGLPAGSYARLKLHYLNVAIASEFAALEVLAEAADTPPPLALAAAIESDRQSLWRKGRGTGLRLTVENARAVVRDVVFRAWFPVQAGVAEWMGDVKVWRPERSLIGIEAQRAAATQLEPGDVLLTRREWYLSNLGLPGYWSHAALYVGTPAERDAYFDEPETRAWVRAQGEPSGRLETWLAAAIPNGHAGSAGRRGGHPVRVLEAISEGVVFTSVEHAAEADSLAVLRPRLPKWERAAALARAFGYAGRPYDFDFDFVTDAALVCTELVYKAYQPTARTRGLALPLQPLLGRLALPANEIARLYDAEAARAERSARQLDWVLFLDGDERSREARFSTEAAFRESWQRPKWHVLTVPADAG